MAIVYLNGSFLPHADARLSIDDRAALFGDGVYEVIRCQGGSPFMLARHAARLRESLAGMRLRPPPLFFETLPQLVGQLLAQNQLQHAKVYLQISRGAAERNHVYGDDLEPTVLLTCGPVAPYDPAAPVKALGAITVEDERWGRCCWKTLMLAPNSIARTAAARAGAGEALFFRKEPGPERLTEGSATNAFAVVDGVLRTHPADRWVLPGITRGVLLEEAAEAGIPVQETAVSRAELARASEVFVSGTITGVAAVTVVDGKQVGDGTAGPVTRELWRRLAVRVVEG